MSKRADEFVRNNSLVELANTLEELERLYWSEKAQHELSVLTLENRLKNSNNLLTSFQEERAEIYKQLRERGLTLDIEGNVVPLLSNSN